MQGSGFRVQGTGFRVQGAGCRVQGAGYRVQGSGCSLQVAGLGVQDTGCRVQDSGSVRRAVCRALLLLSITLRKAKIPQQSWRAIDGSRPGLKVEVMVESLGIVLGRGQRVEGSF